MVSTLGTRPARQADNFLGAIRSVSAFRFVNILHLQVFSDSCPGDSLTICFKSASQLESGTKHLTSSSVIPTFSWDGSRSTSVTGRVTLT